MKEQILIGIEQSVKERMTARKSKMEEKKEESEKIKRQKIEKLENNFSLSFSQNSVYLGYQFFLHTLT